MRKNEVIVKIVDTLHHEYGDTINMEKTKEIVERVLYDYNVEVAETLPAVIGDIRDKAMLYLASRKVEGLSPNSIKTFGYRLRRFSEKMYKNVEDITAMDIRMYLADYAKTGVKNSTLTTEMDVLRGFFSWLETEEYIEKSPMRKIKPMKKEVRIKEALTAQELEVLKDNCTTLRMRALLETSYATGMRVSELSDIKLSDVDFRALKLNTIGKGNKERTVFLNSQAYVHLNKYLELRNDDCDYLFVTERKPITKMSVASIQREFKIMGKQSGLKKNIHPHLLRYTSATHLLNGGVNISSIKEILGHNDLSTTELYSKMSTSNIEYEYRKFMQS